MEKVNPSNGVYLWGSHFMYLGRIEDNAEHSHHALQIIMNRQGTFGLRIEGSSVECGGAIIGADCRHQLLGSGDSQIHLFIDREAPAARTIAGQHLGTRNVKILGGALLKRLRGCIDAPGNLFGSCARAHEAYGKLVLELGGEPGPKEAIDPRIQKVINLLHERILFQKMTIAGLARHACLSESRLMHLFTEQIGIPLRRYVLWLRVLTAMRLVAQGKLSLTEAAHGAGFSDSAHLSRTYKSMYGLTLSLCLNNSRFVQVFSCFS